MKDAAKCAHGKFWAECKVQGTMIGDVQTFALYVSVKCTECNTQFAFPHGEGSISIPITPGITPRRLKLVEDVGNALGGS